jgi:DNA mismatch repair protein MutL
MEGHRDASIVLRGLPSKNLTNPEQHGEKDHTSLPQLLEEKTYVQDRNTSAVTEAEQLRIAEGEQEMLPVSRDEREKLLHARILGQAFKSFIILEDGEELYLIDQHAAHERIRYEKIKKQFAEGKSLGQGLISPITVNMSQLEMNLFKERSGYFEKFGFEAEDFGDRAVIIRAVPSILDGGFSSRDFLDILEKLCQEIPAVSEIIPEETLYMMACQSAIKANRSMSVMEIRGLVEDLVKLKNPYTCVHGRPIIISMNRKELDKRFKRIV